MHLDIKTDAFILKVFVCKTSFLDEDIATTFSEFKNLRTQKKFQSFMQNKVSETKIIVPRIHFFLNLNLILSYYMYASNAAVINKLPVK